LTPLLGYRSSYLQHLQSATLLLPAFLSFSAAEDRLTSISLLSLSCGISNQSRLGVPLAISTTERKYTKRSGRCLMTYCTAKFEWITLLFKIKALLWRPLHLFRFRDCHAPCLLFTPFGNACYFQGYSGCDFGTTFRTFFSFTFRTGVAAFFRDRLCHAECGFPYPQSSIARSAHLVYERRVKHAPTSTAFSNRYNLLFGLGTLHEPHSASQHFAL